VSAIVVSGDAPHRHDDLEKPRTPPTGVSFCLREPNTSHLVIRPGSASPPLLIPEPTLSMKALIARSGLSPFRGGS